MSSSNSLLDQYLTALATSGRSQTAASLSSSSSGSNTTVTSHTQSSTGGGFASPAFTENQHRIRLCLDLPGVAAHDVTVEMQHGVLMVKGSRLLRRLVSRSSSLNDDDAESYFRQQHEFCRRFAIDTDVVDVAKMRANLHPHNGRLVIVAPKRTNQPKVVHIPVTALEEEEELEDDVEHEDDLEGKDLDDDGLLNDVEVGRYEKHQTISSIRAKSLEIRLDEKNDRLELRLARVGEAAVLEKADAVVERLLQEFGWSPKPPAAKRRSGATNPGLPVAAGANGHGFKGPVFGMVCRFTVSKGLDLLLGAEEFFAGEDCRLVVLGGGEKRYEEAVPAIEEAVDFLSRNQFGALIVVERSVPLGDAVRTGVAIDGAVSARLLESIFWPNSPLHDLAVVISGERVVAANVQLPLADADAVPPRLGSRHLAAVGVTEETDAVVVVVSEQTGAVRIATRGRLGEPVPIESFGRELRRALDSREGPAEDVADEPAHHAGSRA